MPHPQTASVAVPKNIHDEMILRHTPNYNMFDLLTFLLERESLRMEADQMVQEVLRESGVGHE